MLEKSFAAAAALLLLSASPLHAQAAPAPIANSESERAALALAEIVAPSELLVPMEIAFARQGLVIGFEADADAKQLTKEYPGLVEAIWAAIEPEVRRSTIADQPRFHALLAKVYAARLTVPEIESMRRFYATPTGQKMIRSLHENIDPTPALAEAARAGDAHISEQSLAAMRGKAAAKAIKTIGPEDEAALEQLIRAAPMAKLQAVAKETQQLTADWVNKEDPEFDASLDELIEAAVEKHLREHSRSR